MKPCSDWIQSPWCPRDGVVLDTTTYQTGLITHSLTLPNVRVMQWPKVLLRTGAPVHRDPCPCTSLTGRKSKVSPLDSCHLWASKGRLLTEHVHGHLLDRKDLSPLTSRKAEKVGWELAWVATWVI